MKKNVIPRFGISLLFILFIFIFGKAQTIDDITNFRINGSPVAHNSSFVLSCGSQNITVTFNEPGTTPLTVVDYEWTFPSGWSGSPTTSDPDHLPFANDGGGGFLKVKAIRGDDDDIYTEYKVNIVRPSIGNPSIAASQPIISCTGNTTTVSASASNATSFLWTPSGGVSSVGATNNSSYSFQNSSSGSVKVTVSSGCGVSKSKTVSVYSDPVFESAKVNGYTAQSYNMINNPALLRVNTYGSATSYSWSKTSGTGSISPTFNTCSASANDFVIVKATGTNTCGTTNLFFFYLEKMGSYYIQKPETELETNEDLKLTNFEVFPNPTKEKINIAFKTIEKGNVKVVLHDISGRLISTIANNQLDKGVHRIEYNTLHNQLSKGNYIISFIINEKLVGTKKLIID